MDKDKQQQEISVIGRLFSIQVLLILMGLFSLGSGIYTGQAVQIFWGVMITGGAILLHFVRKKDWKKHWEEQERMAELYRRREQERKERDAEKRK
ncbi:hypothetical protein [Geobacter sp. DSM 9736]|uniref:hypothetical protein n=1 Tax=Geobacter sp. DSM 9736 TaxID=1277350 RepID=UPI000B50B666|nr:hypothetical protein [Geobacter sp. DSM 9736]SNB44615.1 hypothetical protein SAMN06269301_0002 [Geobacter sp. DSM 9736]